MEKITVIICIVGMLFSSLFGMEAQARQNNQRPRDKIIAIAKHKNLRQLQTNNQKRQEIARNNSYKMMKKLSFGNDKAVNSNHPIVKTKKNKANPSLAKKVAELAKQGKKLQVINENSVAQ